MSNSSSRGREVRRAARQAAHRERKRLKRAILSAAAEQHVGNVRLRWWYRPAVAVVTWWWALTRQGFKADTITKLTRRAAVLAD